MLVNIAISETIYVTLIKKFEVLNNIFIRWSTWKSLYNNTAVLSRATGYKYNYNNNPYPGYSDEARYVLTSK